MPSLTLRPQTFPPRPWHWQLLLVCVCFGCDHGRQTFVQKLLFAYPFQGDRLFGEILEKILFETFNKKAMPKTLRRANRRTPNVHCFCSQHSLPRFKQIQEIFWRGFSSTTFNKQISNRLDREGKSPKVWLPVLSDRRKIDIFLGHLDRLPGGHLDPRSSLLWLVYRVCKPSTKRFILSLGHTNPSKRLGTFKVVQLLEIRTVDPVPTLERGHGVYTFCTVLKKDRLTSDLGSKIHVLPVGDHQVNRRSLKAKHTWCP